MVGRVSCVSYLLEAFAGALLLTFRSMYWNLLSYQMQHIRDEDIESKTVTLRKGSIGMFGTI